MLDGVNKQLVLYLHLTMDCNLRCRYCYSGEKRPERMSVETGCRAIDFFLQRTTRLELRFFGGEPLLEFDRLKQLVDYAATEAERIGKQIDFVIVTNGTLFDEAVSRFCASRRISLSLSFDGDRRAQDANRVFPTGKGSFTAVERNIPLMLAANPYVNVVSVVNPDNLAFLTDSFRYLVDKGFRCISLSPDYTHAEFESGLPEMRRAYYALADAYLDCLKAGRRIFLNVFAPEGALFHRGRCGFGLEEFSVDPHGGIYPCCCFADHGTFRLGHVESGIDGELAEKFLVKRRQLDDHLKTVHRNCPETSFCKKGCGCTNLVTTGDVGLIDTTICKYGRMEAELREYVASGQGRGK